MAIYYGTRLMGKVDEVPGMFHVATTFGHINFVPLVPVQSYIVLSRQGSTFRGVPIRISSKSIFVGYGRALSIALAVLGGTLAVLSYLRPDSDMSELVMGPAVGMLAV